MRKIIRLVSAFILFVSFLAPHSYAKEPARPAPDFKLRDTYQNTYTLSSYKDKQPVLLFFWATWCPFCQSELRVLNQSYAGLVEDGLEVLAIDVGELPDTVEDFITDYYLAYQVLLDKDGSVAQSYGILGIPVYVLIDKQGYIVFQDSYLPYREYKDLISQDQIPNNK